VYHFVLSVSFCRPFSPCLALSFFPFFFLWIDDTEGNSLSFVSAVKDVFCQIRGFAIVIDTVSTLYPWARPMLQYSLQHSSKSRNKITQRLSEYFPS
jgi:hypothetical protein